MIWKEIVFYLWANESNWGARWGEPMRVEGWNRAPLSNSEIRNLVLFCAFYDSTIDFTITITDTSNFHDILHDVQRDFHVFKWTVWGQREKRRCRCDRSGYQRPTEQLAMRSRLFSVERLCSDAGTDAEAADSLQCHPPTFPSAAVHCSPHPARKLAFNHPNPVSLIHSWLFIHNFMIELLFMYHFIISWLFIYNSIITYEWFNDLMIIYYYFHDLIIIC